MVTIYLRTHYLNPFISYLKTSSKVRLMCTTTIWQLPMVQNTTKHSPQGKKTTPSFILNLTHKMAHKDNYLVPKISPRTVRKQSQNLKHTVPKSWNGSHGHSQPHTTQAIWMALKQGLNQVGEYPYLLEFLSKLSNSGLYTKPLPLG